MIEYTNVTKLYNGVVALEDINFEISEGEFTFLIGPSGSGKSTVIKLLIRQEDPTDGSIFFYDTNVRELKGKKISQLRREIGVVFQDFKLLPHKNIYENISFALEVSGRRNEDIQETVSYVLDLIGLIDRAEAFPNEISGGEKQKVAIARAIAHNPKVLIADEPTGNLDPESSWEIIKLLQKINQWGTTVIMATHGSDIVNSLGKRVIRLAEGRVIADNKKGSYDQPPIPIPTPLKIKDEKDDIKKHKDTSKEEKKDKITKEEKDKKKDENKPKKKKKSDSTTEDKNDKVDSVKEKEFEITFTTKTKVPSDKKKKKNKSKKKKRKKRKGKDVVDLHRLKLPQKLEKILIKNELNNIEKLSKQNDKGLDKISDLNEKSIKKIRTALKKFNKKNKKS